MTAMYRLIILLVGLILFVSFAAASQLIYNQPFNNETTGANAACWELLSPGAETIVIADFPTASNKSANFTADGDTQTKNNCTPTIGNDMNFTVKTNVRYGFEDANRIAFAIRLNSSNIISFYANPSTSVFEYFTSAFNTVAGATFSKGKFYALEFKVNSSDGNWYVRINNSYYGPFGQRGISQGYTLRFDPDQKDSIDYVELYNDSISDSSPPTIDFYNMTSSGGCTVWNTNKSSPCTTGTVTPAVSITTDENANCRIGVSDINYTAMEAARDCTSGGGTTAHNCTIISSDALTLAESYIYLSCRDTAGNENKTSTSGALRLNITNLEEADGDRFIELGINDSVIGGIASIHSEKRIYTRTSNNTQALGKFDKIATYGNQIWAINYITTNDSTSNFTYMVNMTPVFYVYEVSNISLTDLRTNVKAFINATRQ